MESGVLPGFFSLLAWAILVGSIALSIALGAVLSFHWYSYAMNKNIAFTATILYGTGCIVILALLLGAVLAAT